jgi:hypothetical protein
MRLPATAARKNTNRWRRLRGCCRRDRTEQSANASNPCPSAITRRGKSLPAPARNSLRVCPAAAQRGETGSRNATRDRDARPREHHGVVCRIIGKGHGIMRVSAKPRLPPVKPSLHLATVVIEDNLPAVDPAGKLGPANFHLRRFVARHPRVGNRDTPEPRRTEAGRRRRRVHISRLVTHFIRDSQIIRNHECLRTAALSSRRSHTDNGCGHLVRNNRDHLQRRDSGEDGLASTELHRRNPRQIPAADSDPRALGTTGRRKSGDFWQGGLCPNLKCREGKQNRSRQSADPYPDLSIAASLHENPPT